MKDYRTPDSWLAAFLICKGYRLVNMDTKNPNRVEFIFDSSAVELVEGYYQGASVTAIEFARQLKRLKDEMYRMIRGENDGAERKQGS